MCWSIISSIEEKFATPVLKDSWLSEVTQKQCINVSQYVLLINGSELPNGFITVKLETSWPRFEEGLALALNLSFRVILWEGQFEGSVEQSPNLGDATGLEAVLFRKS